MSANRQSGNSDVVVVGGVACGPKTAATLARRDPKLSITLFQEEELLSYASCGLPYFASGDVMSFDELARTGYDVIRDAEFFANTKGFMAVTGVEVKSINCQEKAVLCRDLREGTEFDHGYGTLVLATGANPIQPRFPVARTERVMTFTRPADAIAFRKMAETGQLRTIAIVGGGFIGCELAEAAGSLWGMSVTLIEKEFHVLPRVLDPEMAAVVERELTSQGCTLHLGAEVLAIEDAERDGKPAPLIRLLGNPSVQADCVFVCLGVTPNVTLAQLAGLQLGTTGAILVDEHLRTSDPSIYAGGDCVESKCAQTGRPLHLPMGSIANRHGRCIAENIEGRETKFPAVLGSFLVKVFDCNVGSTGLSESAAQRAAIACDAVWGAFADRAEYYPEAKSITLKLVYRLDDHRLLGLQAIGPGDVTRWVDVMAAHLQHGAKVEDLSDYEHGYAPPYAEALDPLHHLAALVQAKERGVVPYRPGQNPDGSNVTWLDVREPDERTADAWRYGNTITIRLGDLRRSLPKLTDQSIQNGKCVVVCRRGPRSYQATLILRQNGINEVEYLPGGTTLYQRT